MDRLHIAVVGRYNINRSVTAQGCIAEKGYRVKSYGTADMITLPGSTPLLPNRYEFGVSYEFIINDLEEKRDSYYTDSGILQVLRRNKTIKTHPEKFQNNNEIFDIIITCEPRVYEEVLQWFKTRVPTGIPQHPVYVVNFNIKDNYKDANNFMVVSNFLAFMAQSDNLDRDAFSIIADYQAKIRQLLLRSKVYYN